MRKQLEELLQDIKRKEDIFRTLAQKAETHEEAEHNRTFVIFLEQLALRIEKILK